MTEDDPLSAPAKPADCAGDGTALLHDATGCEGGLGRASSEVFAAAGCGEPVFAALDLGTNNCRLLVARPAEEMPAVRVVDAFSRVVRLGEGLSASGCLSRAAMDRTIEALRICAAKIRRHRPAGQRIVATEACRRAKNGGHFLERVRRETGLPIETISAKEEARLALAGCSALIDRAIPHAIVFDIGGGSTELMWLDVPREGPLVVRAMMSIPAGVVSLAERFPDLCETLDGYRCMRAEVERHLSPFETANDIRASVARGEVQMVGASGTVTTLAGIHMGLPRYDRAVVDGAALDFAAIATVSEAILGMQPAARLDHPCIGKARADLVVAGCAILDAICEFWPVGRLVVADRGVREGILLGLMGVPAPIGPAGCTSPGLAGAR